MIGDPVTIVTSCIACTIGVMCFAAGLQGYLVREARTWERALLVIAAILLIKPGYVSDIVGLLLLGIVAFVQKSQPGGAPAGAAVERAK
jgi:TRAP-type uncharacterized transport system fused permease subunit